MSRWFLSFAIALLTSGCYVAAQGPAAAEPEAGAGDATVYPSSPPPDPIPEAQPPPPGDGYAWIGGYWDWTGVDWAWDSGYWAPQDAAYVFIGPRFVFVDGRPVYYRPYWRGPGGRRAFGYGFRGRPPGGAFRARPSVEPRSWRAEPAHNAGWRQTPGAGGWRAAPGRGEPVRGAEPVRRVEPMRAAPVRANEGARGPAPMRAGPSGGGRRRGR